MKRTLHNLGGLGVVMTVLAACGGGGGSTSQDMASAAGNTFTASAAALKAQGCDLAPCHGASTTTMLKLTGTAATDFATITAGSGKNGKFVKTDAPADSAILTVPGDAAKHGGSAIAAWKAGNKDYDTLLNWIKAGAKQD